MNKTIVPLLLAVMLLSSCKKMKDPMTSYFVVVNSTEDVYRLVLNGEHVGNLVNVDSMPDLCDDAMLMTFTTRELEFKKNRWELVDPSGTVVGEGDFKIKRGGFSAGSRGHMAHHLTVLTDDYFVLVFGLDDTENFPTHHEGCPR